MSKLRAIVVDDEPVALRRLVRLLENSGEVEVVIGCTDGPSAIDAVRLHKPDLLFLDVQMPGMNGFEVVQALPATHLPFVIFVTAFDQFAVQAFDAGAIDYLLKPFGEGRVQQALERAKLCLRGDSSREEHAKRLTEVVQSVQGAGNTRCLFVKCDDRVLVLQPAEIDWIEADGDYVRIHTPTTAHFTRMKIGEIEKRLAPEGFVRIHRSRLINLSRVREFRPVSRGTSVVVMTSGAQLEASYAALKTLQEMGGF